MNIRKRIPGPVQIYGGKGRMVKKLLPLVPPGGRPYCEPFAGMAALLFARPPAPVEVLNDIDGDIVNLFRVLQDRDAFEALRHRLVWTPYARAEFADALAIMKTPPEGQQPDPMRAWAFFVSLNMCVGGCRPQNQGQWGRAFTTTRGMATTTANWTRRVSLLDAWRERLSRVQIDRRDGIDCIRYWDRPETVFYIDPPYHPDTWLSAHGDMVHVLSHEDYERLIDTLLGLRGAAVLSGYDHEVYRPLEESGWRKLSFPTTSSAAVRKRTSKLQGSGSVLKHAPRVETVWVNPLAAKLVDLDES